MESKTFTIPSHFIEKKEIKWLISITPRDGLGREKKVRCPPTSFCPKEAKDSD